MSISLSYVLLRSLFISAVLVWLNRRGAGVGRAVLGTIGACVAFEAVQFPASGLAMMSQQHVLFWLSFVVLPATLVFALSRLAWLRNRPWWLLLFGPLSFVVGLVLVMVAYNVLFASRQTR